MSLPERLSTLMTQKGVSATRLADIAGVSRQAVTFWKSGQRTPSPEALLKISQALGTTPMWLKTGNDDFARTAVAISEDREGSDEYVFIPEYTIAFGCGEQDAPDFEPIADTEVAYRREFFTRRHINPLHCKRVRAQGDSMLPLICDGDRVLYVETKQGDPIQDGKIYAISYGGTLRIKRLSRRANGDLVIRSENPDYPEEVVPNDDIDNIIRIHGIVIERSGSL